MDISTQIFSLLIISVVVASVAWTVTQEEIFREWREYCADCSESATEIWRRKVFYVFTCEYCFSHWVTLFFIILTQFRLLIDDWRGFVLAFFAIPWIANQLMSVYRRLRVGIKHENLQAKVVETKLEG